MKKIILILILIIFINGCTEKECKTNNDCLTKTCFNVQCKDNNCIYSPISDCCGNEKCEPGESYENCVADCPNCDDKNDCTIDEYDYHEQKCVNTPILDVVCCGNNLCEIGETYSNCARDCPNCNDDNECTKDSYDYHKQECINEVIIPCCGNEICDEDAENYSSCPTDCPKCDDDDRLTANIFNYKTQKCENIVTHYFIDDFEEGTENWVFSDGEGKPTTIAWSTVIEDGSTVLRGTDHNWANLQGKEWDNYIFKFRFKRIEGSMHVNFRVNNDGRYFLGVGGNDLALKKQFNDWTEFEDLTSVKKQIAKGVWYAFEIRGYDNILNIYIDDELLIEYKDTENPIFSGRVAFETLGNSEFLIDDVEIKVITEEDIVYP